MRWLILLLTLLFAAPAWGAAPTFDAATGASGGGAASITVAHTTAGTNRFLFACVRTASEAVTHDSATYNSVSMTQVGTTLSTDHPSRISAWRLVAPASGANNFVANFSATVSGADVVVASFNGVDQTTPLGAVASTSGTLTDISVTVTSATDELVVSCFAHNGDSLTISNGSGQTVAASSLADPSDRQSRVTYKAGASPNVAMSHTWDGTFEFVGLIGVSMKPIAVARRPIAPMIFQ